MKTTDHDPPPTVLDLIDEAVAAASQAAHCCRSQKSRDHFEFALALIRESWIAESGQEARDAAKVVADVREAFDLFGLILEHGKKGGES
tara:strand:+ start:855 stop:1121 length:267 start_codon:yes stop_codon:yes gene_type:complete